MRRIGMGTGELVIRARGIGDLKNSVDHYPRPAMAPYALNKNIARII